MNDEFDEDLFDEFEEDIEDLENMLTLLELVCMRRKIRNRFYLSASDLPDHSESPWAYLWANQNDSAFMATCGFSIRGFFHILEFFEPCYYKLHGEPSGVGRKRTFDTAGSLGLVLHFLNSSMRQKSLAQIFGAPPATISRELQRSMNALELAVNQMESAKIKWPSVDEMKEYSQLICNREPCLSGCFGFADGLNLEIMSPSDPSTQNAFYNGWTSSTVCSQVFAFAPDGTIIFASYNNPGRLF
jgi:hypothetical protein